MNRKTYLKLLTALLTCIIPCNSALADPITLDTARNNAWKFLQASARHKNLKIQDITLAREIPAKEGGKTALYAFNIGHGEGFVLAAGDDRCSQILGYAEQGCFQADNLPCNVKMWLDDCVSLAALPHPARHSAAKAGKASIAPMLKSKWNQGSPYNDQCVFDGTRCYTGCVPTAMAQIMYYWATVGKNGQKFRCGSKAVPGYTTETKGYQLNELPALATFDWEHMTDEEPTTTAGKKAVSTLMRYCGQVVNTDYTNYASGAYPFLVDKMVDYFFYNFTCATTNKSLTTQQWDDLLYNQLTNGKPVVMSGGVGSKGHVFVCDGYDSSNGFYHFNWGWGGSCDGWYSIDNLTPYNYDFSNAKHAIYNIQPLEPSAYAELTNDGKKLTFYYDNNRINRTGDVYLLRHALGGVRTPWVGPFFTGQEPNNVTTVAFDSSMAQARPTSTCRWFYFMEKLTKLDGLKYLNTSETTDMTEMMAYCRAIKNLDVSMLNISNVTVMDGLFRGCSSLESVNVNHWNTRKVTSMYEMFQGCRSLNSLNLSSFCTDNVTNMGELFCDCEQLRTIDVSMLNTANVTDFDRMFMSCEKLERIDVSHFDTSKAEDTTAMFSYCYELNWISISPTMGNLGDDFYKVGTWSKPCRIVAPEGFDFGVDTSGPRFKWKDGYFVLASNLPTGIDTATADHPVDVYNLQGTLVRRAATSLSGLSRGLYIVDGKKIVIE